MISPAGVGLVGLCLISLMLINAQAVTALTSERDGKTLELLLMTDVTAKEFIYGKLGGILYNTKELIVIPLALAAYVPGRGPDAISCEIVYVASAFWCCVLFAAMLGLHSGLSFERSRTAIANSLGTIFFLFIGIFIFMLLLVEARSSFAQQFASFVVFILAGSIALYASLSHKNPSPALMLSAGMLPVPDLLCDHRVPAAGFVGGLFLDRDGLRLYDAGDARSGRERVRRRAGSHHARQGMRLSPPR